VSEHAVRANALPAGSDGPFRVAHLTTVDSTLWYLLRPQLQAVLDSGGEVVAISAPGPWVPALEGAGVRHVPLRSSSRSADVLADVRAARDLWRILRTTPVDLLHTHNPKPGIYGRVVGRLTGVPIVVNTNHGLYLRDGSSVMRWVVLALEGFAARFSDAELIQNPEDLELLTRWRLNPRRRTQLLGNGVDLDRFRPAQDGEERARARAELGARAGQVVVGAVGRLVAEKGFPELSEAAGMLDERYAVVVIGPSDPEKRDALTPAQIDTATRNGVRFLGLRDDVDLLYRGMDVFVLASHREGYPRAAMEAAASGVPVVATDVRGCRQVVADGLTGLLVPVRAPAALAAAINTLGEDEGRRRTMGAAAVERARDCFDERQVVAAVLEAYRRSAADSRRWRRRVVTSTPTHTARG
jgi:glycosyltransferase involved in cell wall biosynthesis